MIDKILFGKRLRQLREQRGLTQEQLSNMLDIEWQHISRLENGKNLPSCNILISIAQVFDIDIRKLTDYEYLDKNSNINELIDNLLELATEEQKVMFYKILNDIIK